MRSSAYIYYKSPNVPLLHLNENDFSIHPDILCVRCPFLSGDDDITHWSPDLRVRTRYWPGVYATRPPICLADFREARTADLRLGLGFFQAVFGGIFFSSHTPTKQSFKKRLVQDFEFEFKRSFFSNFLF